MSLIELREPSPVEHQWLAFGSRGDVGSYIRDLGFTYSSSKHHYQHERIPPHVCKSFCNVEAVLEFMVKHGIPNAQALEDDLKRFVWLVRTCHVDWNAYKDAQLSIGDDLKPEMTTRIVTNESLSEILTKNKVVCKDGRIYLAGACSLSADKLKEGVHYATSLNQLRTMVRETGSLLAPGTKPVGARAGKSGGVAEKLVLQLWAACGETPLPKFPLGDDSTDEVTDGDASSDQVEKQDSCSFHRQRSITEEDYDELANRVPPIAAPSHSFHQVASHSSPKVDMTKDEAAFSDSEGSLSHRLVPYHALLKAKARGDKYKALTLRFQAERNALKEELRRLNGNNGESGQKRKREKDNDYVKRMAS